MLFCYTIEFHPDDEEVYLNVHNGIVAEKDIVHNGIVTEKGICGARTYGEAVDRITEYYGVKTIVQVTIYELQNPLCEEEIRDMF